MQSDQWFGQGFGSIMKNRLGVLSALIVVMASVACEQEVEQPPPSMRLVRTQEVFASGGARIRIFTGAAKAGIESKISFRVPGTLQQLTVEVGDVVLEGVQTGYMGNRIDREHG